MKNKRDNKRIGSSLLNTAGKIAGACIVTAVILIGVILLMAAESNKGKLIVRNNSGYNLEYIKTYFVNSEGPVSEPVQSPSAAADKTVETVIQPVKLFLFSGANLEVRLKFENQNELMTDVGNFNANFDGNIKIYLEKTSDPNLVTLKIKASNGIFSTRTVDCNEEYTINVSEGKILE